MVVPVRGATLASSYSRTTFSLHMRCPGLYNGERALPLIEALSLIPINFHLTGYAEVHGKCCDLFYSLRTCFPNERWPSGCGCRCETRWRRPHTNPKDWVPLASLGRRHAQPCTVPCARHAGDPRLMIIDAGILAASRQLHARIIVVVLQVQDSNHTT